MRLVSVKAPSSAALAVWTPVRSAACTVVGAPGCTAARRCTRSTVMGEPSRNEHAPKTCDQPKARKRSVVSRSRGMPADCTSARSRAALSVSTAASNSAGAAALAASMTTGRPRRNSVCIRSRRTSACAAATSGHASWMFSEGGFIIRLPLQFGSRAWPVEAPATRCEPTGPANHLGP